MPLFDNVSPRGKPPDPPGGAQRQPARCAPQPWPGPVSSQVPYLQRRLAAGSARTRTLGARILKAVAPQAGIFTRGRGTGTGRPSAKIIVPAWVSGTRTRTPRLPGRCSPRPLG